MELDSLSFEIEKINQEIKVLISKRLVLEAQVIDIIGQKQEGTKTCTTKFYKASTVGKLNRSFDKGFHPSKLVDALGEEVADQLIKPKYELVTSAYRALTDEQKAILSQFITTKPAKTSLKIDRLEQD
ncbi:TPA: DUF7173 family protein [Vibrio harveyi]